MTQTRIIVVTICIIILDNINLITTSYLLSLAKSIAGLFTSSIALNSYSLKFECTSAPRSCSRTRYRSYDGSCNNLRNPSWGMPQSTYGELVPNNYADGIHEWPQSSEGDPLPNPREVSLRIFTDKNVIDKLRNLNTMQWGQLIAHDMALTADVSMMSTEPPICCNGGQLTPDAKTNSLCAPIIVLDDDPYLVPEGTKCLDFVRTFTNRHTNCATQKVPAIPLNVVTAYMDMSVTYGSTNDNAASLREGSGGRLLTSKRRGHKWPPQVDNVTQSCAIKSPKEPCYLTGDIRSNQSPHLALLQIILLREHNRIADALSKINSNWNDEKIFQEARRICIAEIQNINYYEYLPLLLGKKNMKEKKLIYSNEKGYVNDYNPKTNPAIQKEHSTAAFRHFHTLIRPHLNMVEENRNITRSIRLSDWFNRPLVLEKHHGFDNLARGLSFQPQDKSDQYWTKEVTQYFLRGNRKFGDDLRAADIHRGRDHGLGTFGTLRKFCNLTVPKTFDDLLTYMSAKNVHVLKSLYKKPEDIDLVVGGSLEKHARGALVGPTFLCILLHQFYITRTSDRFFFENGGDKNIAFTLDQLKTIRQGSSMARLLCDNGNNIKKMQPKAFKQISAKNALLPCDELSFVDLTLWKEKANNICNT